MTEAEALQAVLAIVRTTADQVADIHSRVIVHDRDLGELKTRVSLLESKKLPSKPPEAPPPSKLTEWYSEKSRVFRVPEEDMDQLVAAVKLRDKASNWETLTRFSGRVLAPTLATILAAVTIYEIWHR